MKSGRRELNKVHAKGYEFEKPLTKRKKKDEKMLGKIVNDVADT